MPQSLVQNLHHTIFSTKGRADRYRQTGLEARQAKLEAWEESSGRKQNMIRTQGWKPGRT